MSGAVGDSLIGEIGTNPDFASVVDRTTIAATLGGLSAKATGGNFQMGAYQAAMVHLFNYEVRKSVTENKHYYRIRGTICKVSTNGCDASLANKAFKHVNNNDVPFSSDDKTKGRRNLVMGILPIMHSADSANNLSVNKAIDWHIFSGGQVMHKIHFEGGILYYDVIGIGKGGVNGWLNNKLAEPTFGSEVRNVEKIFSR